MADARARLLPLVGGGDHDWANIFGQRWHVLPHDTQIAAFVRMAGWMGMGSGVLWVLWRCYDSAKKAEAARMTSGHPSAI